MVDVKDVVKKILTNEFIRFLIVGFSTVFVDLIIYILLLSLSININISKLIGFLSGTLYSYNLNKTWTFKSDYKYKEKLLKYSLLYLFSMYLNIQVNRQVLIILTTDYSISYKIAFICATLCSAILNYFGMKYFIFND